MRQIEHFEIMANSSKVRIMRTTEYTENKVSETYSISIDGSDYGEELTREQLEQIRDRINIVLSDK